MTLSPAPPAGQVPVTLPRRVVLKRAGVAGATVLVAATGALSYRVFDTAVLDPDHSRAFDPWRHWRSEVGLLGTVAAAILAANPHNTQAWAFALGDASVDVYADTTRRTGTLDGFDRELHIGLGCAIENLAVAARALGFAPGITLLPDGPSSEHIARVTLAGAPPQPSILYEAIGDRHTNRGPFEDRRVPAETLAAIVDTTGLTDVGVRWVTDDADKAALGAMMIDAATTITEDDEQSRDSFAWFRADDDAIQDHRDGLTLDVQGMSPVMLTLAKLLPAASRATGDRFWVRQTRDVHTRTAAAYGIITAADPYDTRLQLLGGRLLQRIHLAATAAGVALHHMNQITERIDRELATRSQATFAPRLAELVPRGAHALCAFRVGYPVRAARRSPRRPLSAVIR